MNVLVSVIVPVYNSAEYLEACVTSIMSQTLKEIEIIIVDDGSTDASSDLCDSLLNYDSRVKVVHQKNSGASEARNMGLSLAVGEFISFVDSDDRIDSEMLELLYKKATEENAEIATCNFRAFSDSGVRENVMNMTDGVIDYHNIDMLKFYMTFGQQTSIFLWNSIYRRDVIADNNLDFISMKKVFSEDQLFNLCFFTSVNRACFINKSMYNYYIRKNSLCRSSDKTGIVNKRITLVKELKSFIKTRAKKKQPSFFYSYLMWQYFTDGCATFRNRANLLAEFDLIKENRRFFKRCLFNLIFGKSGNKYIRKYNLSTKESIYFRYVTLLMLVGKYEKPVDTFLFNEHRNEPVVAVYSNM
ncbi:MAG TPA: glycosyltransferase [Clostridia bacterium]|nr:glycosyltransferase [Clostridia bacterium]